MHANPELAFLAGGGEMGRRMRETDWAATPFGPIEGWSPSLRATVSLVLANAQPMLLWWGPDYLSLYNDAYIPVLGAKHPWALGKPVRECWSEIYDILQPLIDAPFSGGPPTLMDDIRLDIKRHGFLEETHFTVFYSPVPDPSADGGIGGVLASVHEITGKVVGERRVMLLRDLGQRLAEGRTAEAACAIAVESLATYRDDMPFALLYLVGDSGEQAHLAAATGLTEDQCPTVVDLKPGGPKPWPLAEAARSQAMVVVERSSAGPAVVVPIRSTKVDELAGFLVAGVSPLIRFDELYRSFLDLVAGQAATAIANARAYEEERRKAEVLAEIDRAKTAFFSNVSHEFRTPLTLMLGPLENALADGSALSGAEREQIELAHRSAQRLLKLVNSLLDFSRIEAGRVQANYRPIDLAAATAELASVFCSTVERAGMKLVVDCPPLGEPIYVDAEMWEKIVLNLVSNAFKFTFDGEIEVSLRKVGAESRLTVRDTGTGIPESEIPRLFERFHRISGAQGRSYEGSGIGLALVQELARLHGGRVEVESEVGRGSRFHVFIPLGTAHLPADRIVAGGQGNEVGGQRAAPYLEEMKRWLPDVSKGEPDLQTEGGPLAPSIPPDRRRVLLADDNADMRDYLKRLLEQAGYIVEAVADGEAALRTARAWKPNLVLTDVMMPRLDGFSLLRALRADPQLAGVPIILLSARAGEEARIEGMQAGVDDYLVKPFGARELLARIQGSLGLARVRQEAEAAVRKSEERLRALVNASTYVVYRMNADWTEMLELEGQGFIVDTDAPSTSWLANYIHPDDQAMVTAAVQKAIETKSMFELEHRVLRVDGTLDWTQSRAVPLFDAAGEIVEWFGAASDVTPRVQGEVTRQLLLRELDHRVKNTLATVQAIAHQTLRHTRVPSDFAPRFSNRIEALARVHGLLTEESWRGTSLRHLLREQLLHGPLDDSRLEMSGPEIHLEPQATLHLGLMMHELATNCVKYGAGSVPGGHVKIAWNLEGNTLRLRWVERGGPAIAAPKTRGFGTTLIEQSSKGLGGSARATFDAEGVSWSIDLPLPDAAGTAGKAGVESAGPSAMQGERAVAPPLAGQRILVLEDEPLVAMMVEQVLEEAGATVVAVSSEEEALSALKAGHFDKAALDVNLHGRQVRDVPAALLRIGVPFLFVTGYGRPALPAGFEQAPTLNKPFNNQKLVETLGALGRESGAARGAL